MTQRAPRGPRRGARARWTWLLPLLGLSACDGGLLDRFGTEPAPGPAASSALSAPPSTNVVRGQVDSVVPSGEVDGCAVVAVYRGGQPADEICAEDAASLGLTVVDLADDWVPRVLRGGEAGPVPYAETFVRLANEDLGDDEHWDRALHDAYFELYGVPPSLTVVAKRLADEPRHRCHDDIDPAPLESLAEAIDTWQPLAQQRAERARIAALDRKLAGSDPTDAAMAPWREVRDKLTARFAAITALQAHLRCEGLLDDAQEGLMDAPTIDGMQRYFRRHMLVTWQLDDEARRTLLTDSRELDFRQLLRSLRERVVDATGLIADGTASATSQPVVGRAIDASVFAPIAGTTHGDADLIGAATDAAAHALGWLGPREASASLVTTPRRVAVKLPPPPHDHDEHMDLSIEIDRGDVWYDFPFVSNGDRRSQPRERLPTFTLYRHVGDTRIAMVRWPTTVGGWQPERLAHGRVQLVYKESPVGPRLVRDVIAAPRWIPPESTPTRDLLRPRGHGRWAPRYDVFGPHYASAYGLAMLVHHRDDGGTFTDQGIRSHGSVSYASILDGFSHGCHRLHNHRALRVAGFLVAHREHSTPGAIPLDFHRTLRWRGFARQLTFDSRGYRYELDPPVPLTVLPGRIRGHAERPVGPRQLTTPMRRRYGN